MGWGTQCSKLRIGCAGSPGQAPRSQGPVLLGVQLLEECPRYPVAARVAGHPFG